MAFKSGDKQSANFRDEISQVAQRQMIISSIQAWDSKDVILHILWRLSENDGLPCAPAGSARNDKNQRRRGISAFW